VTGGRRQLASQKVVSHLRSVAMRYHKTPSAIRSQPHETFRGDSRTLEIGFHGIVAARILDRVAAQRDDQQRLHV
jgi:hypothetical protein